MKTRNALFIFYCIAIISSLILFLVFYRPNINEEFDNNTPDSEEVEEDDKTNDDKNNDSDNNFIDDTIYATKFEMTCDKEINIQLGCYVELCNDYYSIEPSNYNVKILSNIKALYSSSVNGISFENNKITANKIGYYRIEFKIAKSKDKFFEDSIRVNVVDNKFILNKTKMTVGESFSVSEIATIDDYYSDCIVESNNNVSFNNNKLTALLSGETNILISYVIEKVKYIYSFNLTIDALPEYYIVVENLIDNKIKVYFDDEYFFINFKVYDKNHKHVSQKVLIEVDNEEICVLEQNTQPLLKFKIKAKGETKVTFVLENDATITTSFVVVVW